MTGCPPPGGLWVRRLAMNEKFAAYAHPEVLVDRAWIEEHLDDPNVRIVESNEDILLYDTGHIPGIGGEISRNKPLATTSARRALLSSAVGLASPRIPPWSSMATSRIGGPAMLSGSSLSSDTKISKCWMVDEIIG